jgi:hypothetical protein
MTLPSPPIIEKIQKLLALANSENEFEAALAATHAQRLLSEYNLAMADIVAAHKPDKADKIDVDTARTVPKWVRHLVAGVGNAFDCQAVHDSGACKITFIGVGADPQVAAYTFAYLDRTIRRLCGEYMKQRAGAAKTGSNRERMRQSYCLGAVSTIAMRLKEQKACTPVTAGALVPIKESLIRQTIDAYGNIRTMRSRSSYVHPDAYSTGQRDGRQISIHDGVEQARSTHEALPQS